MAMTDWDVGDMTAKARGQSVRLSKVDEVRDGDGLPRLALWSDVAVLSPTEARDIAQDLLDAADEAHPDGALDLLTVGQFDDSTVLAVERDHDGRLERAIPDDDGILRNSDGQAYSGGAWSVVGGGEPEPFEDDGVGLIRALEASDAHPDVAEYVRKAREAGEDTGLLDSMRTFHRGGDDDIHDWYAVGTRKESLLWEDGAEVALEKVGNWDVTNRPLLEAVVDGGDADV